MNKKLSTRKENALRLLFSLNIICRLNVVISPKLLSKPEVKFSLCARLTHIRDQRLPNTAQRNLLRPCYFYPICTKVGRYTRKIIKVKVILSRCKKFYLCMCGDDFSVLLNFLFRSHARFDRFSTNLEYQSVFYKNCMIKRVRERECT